MNTAEVYARSSLPLPLLSRNLSRLTRVAVTWEMRRRTRKDLRNLSSQMLSDIGLDPSDAWIEGSKPFWRA